MRGTWMLALAIWCAASTAYSETGAGGFAAVRIFQNGPVANTLPLVTHVHVAREGAQRSRADVYRLEAAPSAPNLFGADLPPGEYRIVALGAVAPHGQGGVKTDAMLAPFTVEAGRITNLGAVLYQPVGALQVVAAPFPMADEEFAELITAHFPQRAPMLQNGAVAWDAAAGWRYAPARVSQSLGADIVSWAVMEAFEADDRSGIAPGWANFDSLERLRARALHDLSAFTPVVVTADATAWLGADWGQVLARSEDGRWSTLRTGSLARVTALWVDADMLIAGDADGRLYRRDGGRLARIGAAQDGAAIIGVHRVRPDLWAVTTQREADGRRSTKVWLTPAPGQFPPAPERSFDTRTATGMGLPIYPPWIAMGREHLVFMLSTDAFHRYRLADGAWSSAPIPRGFRHVRRFYANNDRSLLFAGVTVSTDDAATWRAFVAPERGVTFSAVRDARTAIAGGARPHFNTTSWDWWTTADAGAAWTPGQRGGPLCEGFDMGTFSIDSLGLYVCFDLDGTALVTRDGLTWTRERPAP